VPNYVLTTTIYNAKKFYKFYKLWPGFATLITKATTTTTTITFKAKQFYQYHGTSDI